MPEARRGPASRGGLRPFPRGLVVALAVGPLMVGSCVEELDVTEGELPVPVRVSLIPVFDPLLANTPRSLSLHRLFLQVLEVEAEGDFASDVIELDPEELPESFQIRKDLLGETVLSLEGTVELAHRVSGEESFESVEWAAFVGPLTVTTDEEEWEFEIELGRGNLAEQAITSLSVEGGEEAVIEGTILELSATVEGGPEGARVFWGSQDPEVAVVDEGGTVRALLPGTARIVAAAGRHAEVVELQVVQEVDTVEVTPDEIRLTALGEQAVFQARVLDPRGDEVIDRPIEVVWGVVDSTVANNLGDGVYEAARFGQTEVFARVGDLEGRARVVVEREADADPETNEWLIEGDGAWDDPVNWSLGRAPIAGEGSLDVTGVDFTDSVLVSPGSLNVVGDYVQEESGTLRIEVNGSEVGAEYDRLAVTGSATLGGTLEVLLGAFDPEPEDEFVIVTAASVTGEFDQVTDLGGLELWIGDEEVRLVAGEAPYPIQEVHGVAAGADFTCVLDEGGVAWCWGYNDLWQIGADSEEICTNGWDCSAIPLGSSGGLLFPELSGGSGIPVGSPPTTSSSAGAATTPFSSGSRAGRPAWLARTRWTAAGPRSGWWPGTNSRSPSYPFSFSSRNSPWT